MKAKQITGWTLLLLLMPLLSVVLVSAQEQPTVVTIPGTIQSELGCDEDWLPGGECTTLEFDVEDLVWRGTFELPAGSYEYKVAIDGTWSENYGRFADRDGPNVGLVLDTDTAVTFIYDHATHWVADSVNHTILNVPGDFQSEMGCPGDWAPDCLRSWLQDPDGDGIYTFVTTAIPAGRYEAKVAANESWEVSYGADGQQDGPNIGFEVANDYEQVTFTFDPSTGLLTIVTDPEIIGGPLEEPVIAPTSPADREIEQPDMVVIPGTIQSELGCEGDWLPDGECTALTLNETDHIWRGAFDLPAGSYEYKVAINGSWDENYGGFADAGGPNVPLNVDSGTTIRFYYSHATHWVADSVNHLILTAPGDYQDEIGCPGDWAPDCLRSWLQDPDGDGIYEFSTSAIPAGDYEVKVALDESWDVNYGADGEPGGANIPFSVPETGAEVTFTFNPSTNLLTVTTGEVADVGRQISVNLRRSSAHWLSEDTLAWQVETGEGFSYALHYSPDANLVNNPEGLAASASIPLQHDPNGLSDEVLAKFPHLAGMAAFRISESDLQLIPDILRAQTAISATDANGVLFSATGVQIPGVLDDLFTYDGELGVIVDEDGVPTVRVWAPTAQNVQFHLFANADPTTESQVFPMEHDPATGVWSITGEADWMNQYYLFEVQVYAPTTQSIVTNLVTDPYSHSLTMNSTRSQLVDLSDPSLQPAGWDTLEKPPFESPENIVIYELHMRDFSVNDPAVPEELEGKYLAFTIPDSNGVQHLRALAEAGLTHLHLLPVFDITTINENVAERMEPDTTLLETFDGASTEQAELINPIRDEDAFNWGYDPYHYTVPEGSYATEPNGTERIIEFRQMVQAINEMGLRVVMDVVYNHTSRSGQDDRAVLDRIVPGYYHRLDAQGNVATSTCCANTATEHNMMRKLMVDSVVTWAKAYKVDGFRFDLMGHHMLADMITVREALDSLTLEADGVDGSAIYIYGEGWDFGEVENNARGVNATQLNIGGTGIGVFNDRIRDAIRGGSPVASETLQHQGVVNGLYYSPNGITPGDESQQREQLLLLIDQIRIGLAGNLAAYELEDRNGDVVTGAMIPYGGNQNPTGYTLDPQENIVYAAAHDNETLWDQMILKAPQDLSTEERVRMNNLALSIVGLSQGIPFFHAGDDMLRSKSLDRDSYNSGDWFNKLDFTYQTNNWAAGVPPTRLAIVDVVQPILADERLAVTQEHITAATAHLRETLAIRTSSPLFTLPTSEAIEQRLTFYNTGPDQIPGVIVMGLSDMTGEDIDPQYDMIVVVFNTTPDTVQFSDPELESMMFSLHPVQAESSDAVVQMSSVADGTFSVPGRTTAVFVTP